jgi:hypothetical protein
MISGGDTSATVTVGQGNPTACTLTFTQTYGHTNCMNPAIIGGNTYGWVQAETSTYVTYGFNASPAGGFGSFCTFY